MNSGIVPPTPYRIVGDSLVTTQGDGESTPFITDVTGDLAPGPALYQTSWGPEGPNKVLLEDERRNEMIRRCFQGKAFSGVTKRLGRIRW